MLIDDVNISFSNRILYDNFSINFKDNKINCIVGASGCGKTTLLNYISNDLIKRNIKVSYVFQEDRLIPWKNVFDNLKLVIKHRYNSEELERRIDNILGILDISAVKFSFPDELSGGMKQKINIARALLYDAEVVLLDEPFKSLDVKSKINVIELIRTINLEEKNTIVLISHDENEVNALADYIFLLKGEPIDIYIEGSNKIIKDVFDSIIRE